jgi:hypothetical protein
MQKIHVAENIRLRFSHNWQICLQNICLEVNIRKTLSKFHIQTYSLANICIPVNIRNVLLQIIYESLSQVLGLN